ncbi:MAG: hypothetical protein NTY35_17435 [Planctomycetota bacterium]|nr:hypothetical protein [Planctomycetota bacterium]
MLCTLLLALSIVQAPAATDTRLPLAVLYAGAPGTEREIDWLAFLRANFATVDAVSLRDLTARSAHGYDVVVADWSWRYADLDAPDVLDLGAGALGYSLSEPIPTPIVMVGGIGGEMDRKTKLRGL